MDAVENLSTGATDGAMEVPCWARIGIDGDGSCPELTAAIHCRNCHVFTETARKMLDRPTQDDYQSEWTGRVAAETELQKRNTHSVLIFSLRSEYLALPTAVFREVAEVRSIHRIPGARIKHLLGLVNFHGELHLCIALSALLGIDSQGGDARPTPGQGRMLLMQRGGEAWVFPVDEVHDIFWHNDESLNTPPATVERSPHSFSRGTLEWRGKTVGRLDEAAVFDALKGTSA